MKTILFFLIFLNSSLIVIFGQDNVRSSEEYTNQYPNGFWTRVLGQDETGFYLLRQFGSISSESLILEKYSPSMKMLYATNIQSDAGVMGDSKLQRYTEMSNGKIYIFLEGWKKSTQQNSFIVKTVNTDDGTMNTAETVLETEPGSSQMKSAVYSVSLSPDGSKMVVLTQKPFTKGAKEALRIQVFNTSDFSSIWKKELILENESVRFPINKISVNNDGVAYLLKDIKISLKEHIYQLITTKEDLSITANIDLSLYNWGQDQSLIDANGNFITCGTLTPQGQRDTDCAGFWYLKADASGEILQNNISEVGTEILNSYFPNRRSFNKNTIISDFVVKDVLQQSNGSVVLVGEQQQERKTQIGQAMPPVYDYSLTYGNILALTFNTEGNQVWYKVIEKKQTINTLDPKTSFGSFATTVRNDHIYFVWNFTELRTDPPLNRYRYWIDKNGSKMNVDNIFGANALFPTFLTELDKDGQFIYADRTFNSLPINSIQKGNSFRMATNPIIYFPIDNGVMILSHMDGVDAKRYKFSKITY